MLQVGAQKPRRESNVIHTSTPNDLPRPAPLILPSSNRSDTLQRSCALFPGLQNIPRPNRRQLLVCMSLTLRLSTLRPYSTHACKRRNMLPQSHVSVTYGHSQLKTGHPVRSAIHKQLNGRLVLRWVTTWESLLLYVLFPSFASMKYHFGATRGSLRRKDCPQARTTTHPSFSREVNRFLAIHFPRTTTHLVLASSAPCLVMKSHLSIMQ